MRHFLTALFIISITISLTAQNSWLEHTKIDNIGPTVFSGRVTDIAINPDMPTEFYVAYASGGLWHTTNNGQSMTPIFDDESVMSIGDIDVDWKSRTIYVGTGEVNSSRSSYYGNGIYKSEDNGHTWTHIGLEDTQHIGRVIIDPKDKNTIYVAALGHLYTENDERGVFKTTDGGTTWNHVLKISPKTGAVDMVIDPKDPNILYAAAWERDRKAWNFTEAGSESGIYKSMDKGNSWERITTASSGFPAHDQVGRIGISVHPTDDIVYAIVDNYNLRPEEKDEESNVLKKEDFQNMTKSQLINISDERLTQYLRSEGFPEKYTAAFIKKQIKEESISPVVLKEYVEDANRLLLNSPVIGAEVYASTDGGTTWKKTHDDYLDGVFNSYGYYFGQIRVSPSDSEKVYIMGVPVLKSSDGGANWESINGDNVHVDHHALWINPINPDHLILGNDGGVNISYDDGETWNNVNNEALGQFYYINTDHETPYNVYGGLQDNGVWKGPSTYMQGDGWQNVGKYPYERIMGGDGMQVQVDNRDGTVYTGFQFGNYYRIKGRAKFITPKHELGDRPYRWNWQTPILLSEHNQDILYMGANKVLRSLDQGETFTVISDDLTRGGKKGDVAYGTITTIDESSKQFGKMIAGSDDGLVHVTTDGGNTWNKVWESNGSDDLWISRAVISEHNDDLIYISVNGMRNDDFSPYLYMSDDFGKSWKSIKGNLPEYAINVIKEDPSHTNILYVGNDLGAYISYDGGASYHSISGALPNVPVHDIVVKNDDLLIGTHGRSIYKMNIKNVRLLSNALDQDLFVFDIDNISHSSYWGNQYASWSKANEPNINMDVYSSQAREATYEIIRDGKSLAKHNVDIKKGLSSYDLDLSYEKKHLNRLQKILQKNDQTKDIILDKADNDVYYLPVGDYELKITQNGKSVNKPFSIIRN